MHIKYLYNCINSDMFEGCYFFDDYFSKLLTKKL